MDEVKTHLVEDPRFATSTTRADVWARVQAALEKLRKEKARMPSTLLSGSFITSKLNPSDADLSPLIDRSRILSPVTRGRIDAAVDASIKTLKLDIFPIWWTPEPLQFGPSKLTPDGREYVTDRGLWDDFWQREVPRLERDPFLRAHAMPKKGYLEVIVDGFR